VGKGSAPALGSRRMARTLVTAKPGRADVSVVRHTASGKRIHQGSRSARTADIFVAFQPDRPLRVTVPHTKQRLDRQPRQDDRPDNKNAVARQGPVARKKRSGPKIAVIDLVDLRRCRPAFFFSCPHRWKKEGQWSFRPNGASWSLPGGRRHGRVYGLAIPSLRVRNTTFPRSGPEAAAASAAPRRSTSWSHAWKSTHFLFWTPQLPC